LPREFPATLVFIAIQFDQYTVLIHNARLRQTGSNDGLDTLLNSINWRRGVDHNPALRLGLNQLQIPLTHTAMKLQRVLIETIPTPPFFPPT
jgi:hypothetical protein